MNPVSGELAVPSPLDKPLSELTEDDIAQLTREDCRRFLKQKGMRRPSWNKSQAIQQVISLKALLDSRSDSGDGTRMKAASAPAAVTSPQGQSSSPYRRKDPNPTPHPVSITASPPVSVTCGSRAACVGTNSPATQLTIFYGGRVSVYNDIPAEKARALMQLAASPDAGQDYPARMVVPRINNGPVTATGKSPVVRDSASRSFARESQPEGPTSRQASIQRYREKRKDRYKGRKIIGGSPSPSTEMLYLSKKYNSQTPNEQASRSDTSSPTQPRPPHTPTRCSSIEKQSQRLQFSVDLNEDGIDN